MDNYILNDKSFGDLSSVKYGGGAAFGSVTTVHIEITDMGSWSGSITVNGVTSQGAEFPVGYINAASGAPVSAGTPITSPGLYELTANGFSLSLEYAHTAGEALMSLVSLIGPSSLASAGSGGGGGGGGDVNITEVGGSPVLSEGVPVTTKPANTLGFAQIAASDTSSLVVAMSPARRGLCIRNMGPDTVYLGVDGSVTDTTGFPLPAGAEGPAILGLCIDAVYVICATGDTASVAYWEA